MIVLGMLDAAMPQMVKYAIDVIAGEERLEQLPAFGIIYALLMLSIVFCVWVLIFLAGRLEVGICYELRKKSFEKLTELDISYYDKNPTGHIVTRLVSDMSKVGEKLAWGIVDIVWGGFLIIIIVIIMLWMDVRLALISLSTLPILLTLSYYLQKVLLKVSRKVRKTNSDITSWFQETVNGSDTIKVLNCRENNARKFKQESKLLKKNAVNAATFSALYLPIVMGVGSIGIGFAIYFGGLSTSVGNITPGTLAAFVSYLVLLFAPLREFSRAFTEVIAAQASAERIMELLETSPEITDTKDVEAIFGTGLVPKKANWTNLLGEIEFKDVGFWYNEGEIILRNFNLKVRKGQTIAIVGETGSGKTTTVNLLLRYLEPKKGKILIDGVDYKKRSVKWLHSNIGYVLQTPFIFRGTIRQNLIYAKPDASLDEIRNVCRECGLDEFFNSLKNGYETKIGEGGMALSTGQKQLISIARVMLLNPAIVVLDEATSSIDTLTEEIVKSAVQKLLNGRTSFIIAHRLSTVKNVDKIVLLENGGIKESGDHNELMAIKGSYYSLYKALTA